MKLRRPTVALVSLFLLSACAVAPGEGLDGRVFPPPPSSTGPCLHTGYTGAVVQPSGANVQVNHLPLRVQCPLAPGDVVVTGPGSTATIRFDDGTLIALPENTDPRVAWSANSIKLGIDQGWAWIQTGTRYSVEWVSNLGSGLFYSKGAVEVRVGRTTAYLFEGHMRLLAPMVRELAPMQAVDLGPGRTANVRNITPAEARGIAALAHQRLVITPPPQRRPNPARLRPPPPPIG